MMNRNRWLELEPLLDEALELAPDARSRWLDALSRSAPGAAIELAELLAGESAADRDGFLASRSEPTLAGLELGAWRLERTLGSGGMGSVWLARRADGRFEGAAR